MEEQEKLMASHERLIIDIKNSQHRVRDATKELEKEKNILQKRVEEMDLVERFMVVVKGLLLDENEDLEAELHEEEKEWVEK